MNTGQKRVWLEYVRSALVGVVGAYFYFLLNGGTNQAHRELFTLYTFAACLLFGVPLGLGIILFNRLFFPIFRRLPFLLEVLFVSCGYVAVVCVSFFVALVFLNTVEEGINPFSLKNLQGILSILTRGEARSGAIYAFLTMVMVSFWLNISRKMGPGVMRNWLLGKYRQPREENRIFLFLDVKGSTALAETLGDLKFSGLLRDFFNDLTLPLLETRGEVSHYIGDAAVLTWRLRRGITGENALRCFVLLEREIERRRSVYLARYGVVPEFKAGAHCGNVIATEVGDLKSEIVFHGDVLNTVSRVQGYCNELGETFLVTGDLIEITPAGNAFARSLGEFPLRGKSGAITIYAVGSK